MSSRLVPLAVVFCTALLAGCTQQSSSDAQVAQQGNAAGAAALSDKDVNDLKATVDRWVADAISKREDLTNIIASDMILQPPNSAPIIGHDASVAYLKAYPTITKFTATKDEVEGRGDLAYLRGTYVIDAVLPDKTPVHENGTYLEIHRRQPDGTWPYTRLIWHSTEPASAATKK